MAPTSSQAPKSVSQCNQSQPPPVNSTQPRSPPPTVQSAQWNMDVRDPNEFRASTEERKKRAASRTSKHLHAAKVELEEKRIRQDLVKTNRIRACTKSRPVVREAIVSMREIENLLDESDRVLTESRQLLAQHRNKYGLIKDSGHSG